MSSIAPQRRGSALGDLLDSDFLGLHLESLLVRQPSSCQNKMEQQPNYNSNSILASPFNSHRRSSNDSTRSAAANNGNKLRIEKQQQDARAVSSFSSRNSTSLLSPIDGVFESFFVPEVTPSTSSGSSVQGRIGADSYDYFDRSAHSRHGSETLATTPFFCTSISTSFGRERLTNKTRAMSVSTSSNGSDVSFLSCKEGSMIERQLDRRSSDGTDGTGITTPPTGSEGAFIQEKEWPAEEMVKAGSTSDAEQEEEEESDDQTTWTRFKEGGVIEPPEVENQAPSAASWVKTNTATAQFSARSQSRYTSMISNRPKSSSASPGIDTVNESQSDKQVSKQINRVTLVAFGDNGRSFRFTNTTCEPSTIIQPSYANHFSTFSSSSPKLQVEPWQSGSSPKQQIDTALFGQQQTTRVSGRSRPSFPF